MKSLKVLIIDDSQTIRMDIRNKLESIGHQVVGEAVNGVEGLEMVKQLHPDLVTLDIIMPEMDGIECYRMLRNLSYPPRCLLVSALANEIRVTDAYKTEIEPHHYIDKGCTTDDLGIKIEEICNQTPLPIPFQKEKRPKSLKTLLKIWVHCFLQMSSIAFPNLLQPHPAFSSHFDRNSKYSPQGRRLRQRRRMDAKTVP